MAMSFKPWLSFFWCERIMFVYSSYTIYLCLWMVFFSAFYYYATYILYFILFILFSIHYIYFAFPWLCVNTKLYYFALPLFSAFSFSFIVYFVLVCVCGLCVCTLFCSILLFWILFQPSFFCIMLQFLLNRFCATFGIQALNNKLSFLFSHFLLIPILLISHFWQWPSPSNCPTVNRLRIHCAQPDSIHM